MIYEKPSIKKSTSSGSVLRLTDGDIYVGSQLFNDSSICDIQNEKYATNLHVNGQFTWNAYIKGVTTERRTLQDIAAHTLKVYQHSNNEMLLRTNWYGTVIAPYSKLTLGNNNELTVAAGQFLAKEIIVSPSIEINHFVIDATARPADSQPSEDIPSTDTDEKDSTGKDDDAIKEYNFAARGNYFVTVKQNGRTSSKMLVIK